MTNDKAKRLMKNKSTKEGREFWEFVEKTAKKAKSMKFQRGAVKPLGDDWSDM